MNVTTSYPASTRPQTGCMGWKIRANRVGLAVYCKWCCTHSSLHATTPNHPTHCPTLLKMYLVVFCYWCTRFLVIASCPTHGCCGCTVFWRFSHAPCMTVVVSKILLKHGWRWQKCCHRTWHPPLPSNWSPLRRAANSILMTSLLTRGFTCRNHWAILWGPSRWRPPRNDLIFEYFTLRSRFP